MKTRKFEQNDYETLTKWWKDHNWFVIPPLEILSKDGFVAIDEENQPTAACFIYYAGNAPFAFLGLPVTRKDGSDRKRLEALMSVVDAAKKDAIERNVKLVLAYTEHPTIVKILQKNEFQILETTSTVLGFSNFDISSLKEDKILIGEGK